LIGEKLKQFESERERKKYENEKRAEMKSEQIKRVQVIILI